MPLIKYRYSTHQILHIVASLLAGFFVVYSITDADIWWHLAAGREMVARKAFLFSDPFSFTTAGAKWIDVHWLFQLVMYAIHTIGGNIGLLVFTGIVVASAFWIISTPFIKNNASALMLCGFAAVIFLQRYLIPVRPIIVTLLAVAVIVAAIERYTVSGRRRYLLYCCCMQLVWVNAQGLFLLGPVIVAAYAVGEALQMAVYKYLPRFGIQSPKVNGLQLVQLALLPIVLVAVSLINPYGADAIVFSIKLFIRIVPTASNVYSSMITENMPLFSMVGTMYSQYVAVVAGISLLLVIAAILIWKNLRFSHYTLAACGLLLALMAQRNGILFTFFSMPVLLHAASVFSVPSFRYQLVTRQLLWGAMVLAIGFCAVKHTQLLCSWPHTVSPFSHPTEIVKYIKKHPFEGALFNADRYGGYLIWNLYPHYKVSSDTRLTLRSNQFFREYMNLTSNPESFDVYAWRWNITHVALPLAPVSLYHNLAKYLYRHPAWICTFTDGAEVLFEKRHDSSVHGVELNDPVSIDSTVASLKLRYTTPSVLNEALTLLAQWCLTTESFTGAERVVAQCKGTEAAFIRASARSQQGYFGEAEHILCDQVAAHPRTSSVRMVLVNFYRATGHEAKAREQLALLLKKDPFYPPARKLLFTISTKKGNGHD